MKIKILDSILHGELKPWKVDTFNERQITALVKAASINLPKNISDVQNQLFALLTNYPSLQKIIEKESQNEETSLTEHFFKIELPKYKDPLSQFYFLIITKESQRFFNRFLLKSKDWIEPVDIHFQVNKTLTNIRVLATQTAEELSQRTSTTFPDKQSEITYFVLFTLKQILTVLFFEIQEKFKNLLLQTITEEFFYLHYLKEPHPIPTALIPDRAYFEFHLNSIQKAVEFSESDARRLLTKIKKYRFEESFHLQAVLENLIFLNSKNIEVDILSINTLVDVSFVKENFEAARAIIFKGINQNNYGYQRLEIIQNKISELDYVSLEFITKNSIPSLLLNWLANQRDIYKANPSAVFSKDINADDEAARLKNPLSKKNKATFQQQKQYAKEHLTFLSGYNIKNEKIMPDADFNRMMEYTYFLIEKEKLPQNIKVIHKIGFANNAIRYTFYKIHEYLYGTQSIKQNWIEFLHVIFMQFNNTALSTTKAKFSEKPKSYDNDIKQMEG